MTTTATPGKPDAWTPKLNDLLSRVVEGHETALEVAGEPGNRTVKFSLQRQLPPEPRPLKRAESPARAHDFYEARGFAAYLARYGEKGDVTVYADPSTETCWAILKEKAEGGVEQLKFSPQIHPLWKPWAGLAKRGKVLLTEFRDFLNQNRRVVVTPPGRALSLLLAQIRGNVEVEIQDGRGKDALNGIMVKSKVQGLDDKSFVPLPEELIIKAPLYVGCEIQEIHLDLIVDTDASGKVTVQIAAGDVAQACVLAFDDMLATIREDLKDKDAVVAYGKPSHTDWNYLDESGA